MRREIATKHHPIAQSSNMLDLDIGFEEELTDEQKADLFMSKYMDTMKPLERYSKYFESSAKSFEHILRDVKLNYKKLVLNGSWTERKYVTVIDDILTNRSVLSVITLDRGGLMYDKNNLASQRNSRGNGRRRIR